MSPRILRTSLTLSCASFPASLSRCGNSLRWGLPVSSLRLAFRALPYRRYVIYYHIEPDAVVIVRVLHAARDARAIFGS
jgi:plasmid stabilization system protein ParE